MEYRFFGLPPINAILLGSIVAAVGVAITFIGTWMHNKNSSAKTSRIDLNAERAANLSDTTYKTITGGESFPVIQVTDINETNDRGAITFIVEGNFPLSNVKSKMVDLNPFLSGNPMTEADAMGHRFELGTLVAGNAYLTEKTISLDKAKGVNLNFQTSATNGTISQMLRMRFVNGEWLRAVLVRKFGDSVALYKSIDPNYPGPEDSIFKR